MSRADSPTKLCTRADCERPMRAKGLCVTHYNQKMPNRHAAREVECAVCGSKIRRAVRANRTPTCSVECRTALQFGTVAEGGYDWASAAASRARRADALVVEVFDRAEIFQRDCWTCGVCGDAVDPDLDPYDPMSATVDHVVPLVLGGVHSRANAQCAHLRCNSLKDNTARRAPAIA